MTAPRAPLHETLALLASRFEAQGQHLRAIHCLHCALSLPEQLLLPDQEARLRARLGRLLLRHTHNLRMARVNLQQAVRQRGHATACSACMH